MASVSARPELSAKQLAALETQVQEFGPRALYPSSTQAQQLFEEGLIDKAYNFFHCGRFAREYECPKGDKWNQARTCKQRFCKDCAPRLAKELLDWYQRIIRVVQETRGGDTWMEKRKSVTFQYLQMAIPLDKSTTAVQRTTKTIRKAFRSIIQRHESSITRVWFNTAGFEDGKLIARALWWGDEVNPDVFRSLLPGVESVITRHVKSFQFFFGQMVAPLIPSDCRERARMERVFDGIRRLHAIGTWHSYELFPCNTPYGNNVTSEPESEGATVQDTQKPDPRCPVCRPKCPYCGELAVKHTDFKLRGTEGKWYNFPEDVPRPRGMLTSNYASMDHFQD